MAQQIAQNLIVKGAAWQLGPFKPLVYMNPQGAITTVTFFRYESLPDKWWGFKQMGLSAERLKDVAGLRFYKMLGSGAGNGFSIWPNFGVYGLLQVWEDEAAALAFGESHELFRESLGRAAGWWRIFLQAAKSHGEWEGASPFPITTGYDTEKPVAVLTRATIYPRHLWRFWRFVPPVSRSIAQKEGLLFSVGVGELPLIQQATFSLWANSHHMMAYAYQSEHHKKVVRRTRELGWYREELFCRFHPYRSEGDWENGQTPADSLFHPLTA